jgi:hypothetical protein
LPTMPNIVPRAPHAYPDGVTFQAPGQVSDQDPADSGGLVWVAIHSTQDENGEWTVSLEDADGGMHGVESRNRDHHDMVTMVKKLALETPGVVVHIDAPRRKMVDPEKIKKPGSRLLRAKRAGKKPAASKKVGG